MQTLADRLLDWFAQAGRDLPWRRPPRTAYRVLVAELMLQQTRAEVVAQRFEAFLDRFPDFAALARVPPADVLRAWEGLGYYRRAEALWRTAQAVRDTGGLPEAREELLRLPGIGPYSASAVRSFAFSLPDPPLDANLRRVALRLAADPAAPGSAAGDRTARSLLSSLLLAGPPPQLCDALMDLAATICVAAQPRCDACPLRGQCAAWALGRPETFGRATPRPPRRALQVVAMRIESEAGLLWRPREAKGLLAGLWEPPHVLSAQAPREAEVLAEIAAWGVEAWRDTGERWPMRHAFTHQVWTGEVRRLWAEAAPPAEPARWLDAAAMADIALPSAFRAVLRNGG